MQPKSIQNYANQWNDRFPQGFYIINKEGVNIAATSNLALGKMNLIFTHKEKAMNRIF